MPTTQLFQPQPNIPLWVKYALWAAIVMMSFIIESWLNLKVASLFFATALILLFALKQYVYGQNLGFTFTETHFQQHLFKGGWVLNWTNIQRIGECSYDFQGWCTPIPWIGIEIKEYQSCIERMSPKIITQILLHQRSLLMVGLKQHGRQGEFEDFVMNDTPYTLPNGRRLLGLQAMLANRMAIQKELWGFDLFIAEGDLIKSKEVFIGMARRYLAASHNHQEQD
ncbi:DUF2982 domain-containing protein [Vibrio rumoiensis]|uniref:DUF2982 domain-containing protein n=1 Tax=Vibrio rumoiensis 1S-45 TaxID=1188252 RepID=A0A1E5E5M2_9VIBR|nr:DUF2982 domain-containing protein [Vibrio rumoiensis]OEF29194.1 hypothetical protein A1QC_04525 [Vibrio rumoiensis 1S-45]